MAKRLRRRKISNNSSLWNLPPHRFVADWHGRSSEQMVSTCRGPYRPARKFPAVFGVMIHRKPTQGETHEHTNIRAPRTMPFSTRDWLSVQMMAVFERDFPPGWLPFVHLTPLS